MKYTREDVIVTKEQAKKAGVRIGSECYFGDKPSNALNNANNDNYLKQLYEINWECELPFTDGQYGIHWDCIILKKEPKKQIVPFDFSLKEDRDALMGKRIHREWKPTEDGDFFYEEDGIVYTFIKTEQQWICHGYGNAESLFKEYVFADTGKPVGKEIEE